MNYSIHTFELSMIISKSEYLKIKKHIKESLSEQNRRPSITKKELSVKIAGDKGVTVILSRNSHWITLKLRVNLSDYFGSYLKSELPQPSPNQIDNLIRDIEEMLPLILPSDYCDISLYEISRLDFSVNVDMKTEENLYAYLHLLRKGKGLSKGFKLMAKKHSGVDYSSGVTFLNENTDSAIALYDKKKQIEKVFNLFEPESEHILRLELRLQKRKAVRKFFGDLSNAEIIKRAFLNSKGEIIKHINLVLVDADYYKLDDAIRRVEKQIQSKKQAMRMITLLKHISKYHRIDEAVRMLKNDDKKVTSRTVSEIFTRFVEINVNPVTVGKRQTSCPSFTSYLV